jgi:hypothetical protein
MNVEDIERLKSDLRIYNIPQDPTFLHSEPSTIVYEETITDTIVILDLGIKYHLKMLLFSVLHRLRIIK